MLTALREAGIRNYTIFRHGNEVFGYFEADDLEAAAAYMETQEGQRALAGHDGQPARCAGTGRRAAGTRSNLPSSIEPCSWRLEFAVRGLGVDNPEAIAGAADKSWTPRMHAFTVLDSA